MEKKIALLIGVTALLLTIIAYRSPLYQQTGILGMAGVYVVYLFLLMLVYGIYRHVKNKLLKPKETINMSVKT